MPQIHTRNPQEVTGSRALGQALRWEGLEMHTNILFGVAIDILIGLVAVRPDAANAWVQAKSNVEDKL